MAALTVHAGDDSDARALSLAERLGLPVVFEPAADREDTLFLAYRGDRLVLGRAGSRDKPVSVDFTRGALSGRRQRGTELLVKAVGGGARRPAVVDATAGLARDAFVLADHGYPLTLLERNPALCALVEDGLRRAAREPATAAAAARMRLLQADAVDWLERLPEGERPDVIYLDPMFATRDKTALVKKELRLLQELIGGDPDSERLLATALRRARHRVVVKRPAKAAPLADRAPGFAVTGKAVRFDVYPLRRYEKSEPGTESREPG